MSYSALIYSIVETAKANNLNPFRYLEFLLTQMMDHEDETDYSFIDKLLPCFIGKFDFSRGKEKDIRSLNVCQAW